MFNLILKMRLKINILLIIPLIFMALSCNKNDTDRITRKDVLCEAGKHYILIAKTVTPSVHINYVGYEEIITDLFDQFALCQKQVLLNGETPLNVLAEAYFFLDGTYTYDDYVINNNINDSLILHIYHPYVCNTGTWSLNTDETILTMTSSQGEINTSKIIELTSSDTTQGYLIISNDLTYKNVKYIITSKYMGVYSFP
jgi:hypothetical protein